MYGSVAYTLHSYNTNIDGAPFTKNPIPCGAIEEYNEILNVYPEENTKDVTINLKGHGSLVMASNLEMFKDIPYISRPSPELMF